MFLALWLLLTFFIAYFEAFKDSHIHCTLLHIWKTQKKFSHLKLSAGLLCCLVLFKYVFRAIFCLFYMKMDQLLLTCCNLRSKYTKHTLFISLWLPKTQYLPLIVSVDFENINPTFFPRWNLLNMSGNTLFVLFLLLKTLFLLFSKVWVIIASKTSLLLYFHLENHHSYFSVSCVTTLDLYFCLFWDI